ncbi:HDOD domain-containing protein [Formivibrio citricus]|uniref:HDOD domain-containing protein n=1 Tax=Formivibrio citricus TaxID=83765 RepID=A0A1I4ZJ67_9NEIS|nr:HDOD domain-containing protein [Formivibrio citricus]SFN50306.1 HDOD domain-containing protein [Formivibrio citricus]
MFKRLRALIFGSKAPEPSTGTATAARAADEPASFTPEALSHLLAVETVVDRNGRSAGKFIRLRQHGAHPHVSVHSLHEDAILLESIHRLLAPFCTSDNRILLVELGAASLPHPIMDELAACKAVLLLAPGGLKPDTLQRLQQLKTEGLRLALCLPCSWPQELLALADGFAFSFDGHTPVEAAEFVETSRRISPKASQIVIDIGWREEYAWCRSIGCHYAAGRLFRNPDWPDEPLDPGFVHVLDILNKVRQEAEPAEIARAMKSDPLLSFRLLAQANSASQGLAHKVESIEQAVVVVGRCRLYRWLVLLLYAKGKHPEEGLILQEMAQVRAELMVRLGARYLPGEDEGLYLTGLFSMLEPLMQRPLARILADVDVQTQVRQALLENSGPYAPFLALAEAAEQAEPPSRDLLAACGIAPHDFNRCLLDTLIDTESAEQETIERVSTSPRCV